MGGVVPVDFEQDGMLDVFETGLGSTNRPYRNMGNRTFILMTSAEAGAVSAFKTRGGGSWADYDDDGWLDCTPQTSSVPADSTTTKGADGFRQ